MSAPRQQTGSPCRPTVADFIEPLRSGMGVCGATPAGYVATMEWPDESGTCLKGVMRRYIQKK